MEIIKFEEFNLLDVPIIDVRSPGEYQQSHIPGALNVPLLNDEHRRLVGIAYKQTGKDAAIELGHRLVDPIRNDILENLKSQVEVDKIRVYCARGGLRSQLMSRFFSENGFHVKMLKGGYKTYRNYVLGTISEFKNIKILSGYTGSGKTEILQELKSIGAQVLDLEELANHRGSAFGALGKEQQPSSAQFHNRIFEVLKSYDPGKTLWVESESVSIGKVYIPEQLWANMKNADGYEVILPVEERVKHTLDIYGHYDPAALSSCIRNIAKRLGGLEVNLLCELVEIGDLEPVVERLLKYYDKAYELGREKRDCQNYVKLHFSSLEPRKIAEFLQSRLLESI